MAVTDRVLRCASRDPQEKSLALHEIALDTMAHGVCMYDADLRVVLFNRAFVDHYELCPDRLRTGMTMREIFLHAAERLNLSPELLESAWIDRLDGLAGGQPFDNQHDLPDGRTISLHMRPMKSGGWVAVYEDVTAQKALEREQRLNAERLGQAMNLMSSGLSLFDADERLILANKEYYRIYNIDPEVVVPGISLREKIALANARGTSIGVSAEEDYAERSRHIVAPDGPPRLRTLADGKIIEVSVRPTSDGGWVSYHEDVTSRLRHEQELREQNLRFNAALNNMSQGLAMFDAGQRLIVCNERYLEIFGTSAAEMREGISLRKVFEDGVASGLPCRTTAEALLQRRLALLAEQKPVIYDQELACGRTIAISVCPMANGGWLATFDDITESRRLERERAAALTRVREQNLRFDAAMHNMSNGLAMFDYDHRLIVCNQRYLTVFRSDAEIVRPGASMREIFAHGVEIGLYPGLTVDDLMARRLAAFAQRDTVRYDQDLDDGRTIEVTICPMESGGWVVTYEDVTDARRLEQERSIALHELQEQNCRFDAALNHMPHGLCMLDDELHLIVCNQRYLDMFGFAPDVVKPGVTLREIMTYSVALGNYPDPREDHYSRYIEQLQLANGLVHRHLRDGRTLLVNHRPNPHGGWVLTFEDITERLRAEQQISHMARHDALTGLPNRVLFREKMAEGLDRVEARGTSMAVLCLDLDNFKTVNDTLGHPVGDQLLTAVACRLSCLLRKDDTIARLGGDEFAILQEGGQPEAAITLARRIIDVVSEPVLVDGHEINTGVSVGIAVAPADGLGGDHLMKCADLALYRAKADGRARFRLFEPDMDVRVRQKRMLEIDLRKALSAGEFYLAYQPQIRASDYALRGMEALLRWEHAERGAVLPSEFIPVAEETGLIVPLGEWVLRRACAEAASWPLDVRVAVNLSPVQFRSRGLVGTVTGALAAAGLCPSRLELEITEAVLLQDDEGTIAALHQLRALGVRISMDDFGTGYSSLSYLRSFPFDKIKIDRSFIADLDRSKDSAAIIRAIAGLGASLGIETTAEGVETAEQFERVRRDGCTEIQGYFFGPPCAAERVFRTFADWRRDKAVA